MLEPFIEPIIKTALNKIQIERAKILMGNLEVLAAEKNIAFTDAQLRLIKEADAQTSAEILKRFKGAVGKNVS